MARIDSLGLQRYILLGSAGGPSRSSYLRARDIPVNRTSSDRARPLPEWTRVAFPLGRPRTRSVLALARYFPECRCSHHLVRPESASIHRFCAISSSPLQRWRSLARLEGGTTAVWRVARQRQDVVKLKTPAERPVASHAATRHAPYSKRGCGQSTGSTEHSRGCLAL
jgi:hypothetical protein